MSVYKVPQDVEAEDKLVGPFTLKQFIFLIVALISGYLTFILGQINIILIFLTLPFTLVFLVLGVYRRPDQPVEAYLASLVRFYFKPRLRLWDQDGILESVKITAPPKIERVYTDGRSEGQVVSQLQNLANVMDTRGWSSKNASVQMPGYQIGGDRLISNRDLQSTVQPTEVHAADDIMDYNTNNVAQTMNSLAQGSVVTARQTAIQQMEDYTAQQQLQQAQAAAFQAPQQNPPAQQATSAMTEGSSPDIIRLSQNSDFSVDTIARQAGQSTQEFDDQSEVNLR